MSILKAMGDVPIQRNVCINGFSEKTVWDDRSILIKIQKNIDWAKKEVPYFNSWFLRFDN